MISYVCNGPAADYVRSIGVDPATVAPLQERFEFKPLVFSIGGSKKVLGQRWRTRPRPSVGCALEAAMRLWSVVIGMAVLAGALTAPGCRTVYYSAWEALGTERREMLRSELLAMVDDQESAREAFTDSLSQVKGLTNFQGGQLEREYERLKGSYEDSEAAADQIDSRISDIEHVAEAMFEEWNTELAAMQAKRLKEQSRETFRVTRERYDAMHLSLVASRDGMRKVLRYFHDHVLFLKHNLNAQAMGSLGESMQEIEVSIDELKVGIESAIQEAQGFLKTLE